jgi:hypothetical protein
MVCTRGRQSGTRLLAASASARLALGCGGASLQVPSFASPREVHRKVRSQRSRRQIGHRSLAAGLPPPRAGLPAAVAHEGWAPSNACQVAPLPRSACGGRRCSPPAACGVFRVLRAAPLCCTPMRPLQGALRAPSLSMAGSARGTRRLPGQKQGSVVVRQNPSRPRPAGGSASLDGTCRTSHRGHHLAGKKPGEKTPTRRLSCCLVGVPPLRATDVGRRAVASEPIMGAHSDPRRAALPPWPPR